MENVVNGAELYRPIPVPQPVNTPQTTTAKAPAGTSPTAPAPNIRPQRFGVEARHIEAFKTVGQAARGEGRWDKTTRQIILPDGQGLKINKSPDSNTINGFTVTDSQGELTEKEILPAAQRFLTEVKKANETAVQNNQASPEDKKELEEANRVAGDVKQFQGTLEARRLTGTQVEQNPVLQKLKEQGAITEDPLQRDGQSLVIAPELENIQNTADLQSILEGYGIGGFSDEELSQALNNLDSAKSLPLSPDLLNKLNSLPDDPAWESKEFSSAGPAAAEEEGESEEASGSYGTEAPALKIIDLGLLDRLISGLHQLASIERQVMNRASQEIKAMEKKYEERKKTEKFEAKKFAQKLYNKMKDTLNALRHRLENSLREINTFLNLLENKGGLALLDNLSEFGEGLDNLISRLNAAQEPKEILAILDSPEFRTERAKISQLINLLKEEAHHRGTKIADLANKIV